MQKISIVWWASNILMIYSFSLCLKHEFLLKKIFLYCDVKRICLFDQMFLSLFKWLSNLFFNGTSFLFLKLMFLKNPRVFYLVDIFLIHWAISVACISFITQKIKFWVSHLTCFFWTISQKITSWDFQMHRNHSMLHIFTSVFIISSFSHPQFF